MKFNWIEYDLEVNTRQQLEAQDVFMALQM